MKKYSKILGTGSYVPSRILTNADLEKMVETSDEWITDRTGIKRRHIRDENDTTISMATEAGRKALEASGIDKNKIGLIIVATTFPDRLFPNTASAVQLNLGLAGTKCPAFDISAACAGFIYALSLADMHITSGKAEYVLIVSSESITRVVDWNDRNLCILFGDGAGAVVLGASNKPGIYSTHLHLDSNSKDLLSLSGNIYGSDPCYIQMRGNEVFKIAVTKLGEVVDETLLYNNLKASDVDWLVPHQANLRIIKATAKRLGIPMEKVILTIAEHGNTSAASVPLALDYGVRNGLIKRDQLLLLEAFGAGLTWGSALVRY